MREKPNTDTEEFMPMNEFLARIIDAHGGIDCWNRFERIETTIVSGGGFFRLEGAPRDSFVGHQMHTPWDALHRAFFNGYAM